MIHKEENVNIRICKVVGFSCQLFSFYCEINLPFVVMCDPVHDVGTACTTFSASLASSGLCFIVIYRVSVIIRKFTIHTSSCF